jgi:hypothetical protein
MVRTRPADPSRPAHVDDVHTLAAGMPHVTVEHGPKGNPVYQVGRKSFVYFRTPRTDAADPQTGEKYHDVIMFWVGSQAEKTAMIQDRSTPYFSTPHFDAHSSVLIRACRLNEITRAELAEVIQEAWLSRASDRRAQQWLSEQGLA